MQVLSIFIVWACKMVSRISRILRFGTGATWPGEVAIRLNPHILSEFVRNLKNGVILIAGTNGKTTTALMIKTILENDGLTVVSNTSGANLENGIVSACIQSANWSGKIDADYGVFEVDENALPQVVSSIKYQVSSKRLIIVLLNLFRDQLDRYGEVDVIAEKWAKALLRLDTGNQTIKPYQLIANADDPLIVSLSCASKSRVTYFGLDDPSQFQKNAEHATDSAFCPFCGARLLYEGYYYSHIGVWKCEKCKAKRPRLDIRAWEYPLPGLYNRYNTLAAVAVAQALDIKQETINKALKEFTPAFGRQEEFDVDGKRVKIFLSKNPTGFNQSLRTAMELGAKHMLFVLNDRIPDGRDVSWIWDVDFEVLAHDEHVITVSGDRTYDLALRLKYGEERKKENSRRNKVFVEPDLDKALQRAFEAIPPGETLYILATYSAMLEIRKILRGRKIL